MTAHFSALLAGCILDLLLGDPHWMPHPVRVIGALITTLERPLRAVFSKTRAGERWAGAVMALLVVTLSAGAAFLLLSLSRRAGPRVLFAMEALLSYQCLAARSLRDESMAVYRALKTGALAKAREAVSRIVGRDTDRLDETGVARAAVETVAENASDGVIAPLLYLALGGPVLGFAYKAVNTMDSMVGYHNERYENFGFYAAKLDDGANYLPARLSGLLLCLAAPAVGLNGKNALRIYRRDRRNHKSPNSAHTEAAAAGALGLRLAGPGQYFGRLVEKPFIGDELRPVTPEDIRRANRLMLTSAALAGFLFCVLPLFLSFLL